MGEKSGPSGPIVNSMHTCLYDIVLHQRIQKDKSFILLALVIWIVLTSHGSSSADVKVVLVDTTL